MTHISRYLYVLLALGWYCGTAQAQSIPTAVIVFGEKVWFKDDNGSTLTDACVASLKSAIQRCINAGGKPDGLTDLVPTIQTYRITSSDGSINSTSFTCQWNIACVFPSREAVPYIIEGQF